MAYKPDTVTGTITLTEGEAAFTTIGTNMLTRAHQPGDSIMRNGLVLVIETIDGENAGTLRDPCPAAAAGIDVPVRIRYQPDGSRVMAQATNLVETLGASGNLEAFAQIEGAIDLIPIFTGPGVLGTINKADLTSGVEVDEKIETLPERAAFDGKAAGFTVQVNNIGDGRSAVYFKKSNANADWSIPSYLTGPVGPLPIVAVGSTTTLAPGQPATVTPTAIPGGVELDFGVPAGAGFYWEHAYDPGSAYTKDAVVRFNGSTFIAAQAVPVGQAPSGAFPPADNAYWEVVASKGQDGTGTGDIVGPATSVSGEILVAGNTTGKLLGNSGLRLIDLPQALHVDRYVDNQQYLWPFFQKLLDLQPATLVVNGDSTTAGHGVTGRHRPEAILRSFADENNVRGLTITNTAVSGADAGDWEASNVATDMALDPDIYISHFGGINDAYDSPAVYRTRIRNAMDAARSHANGGVGDCGMMFMTSNTIDEGGGSPRTSLYLEEISPMIREACAEYHFVWFDTFQMWRDAITGRGFWLDDPFTVHPDKVFNALIWGAAADIIMPRGIVRYLKNITGGLTTVSVSDLPSTFVPGNNLFRTTSMPRNGQVEVTKHADLASYQLNWGYFDNKSSLFLRTARVDGVNDSWNPWLPLSTAEVAPVVASGFTPFALPNQPRVIRQLDEVLCAGAYAKTSAGVLANTTTICTFPANYRPSGGYQACSIIVFHTGTSFAEVLPGQVLADGTLRNLKASSANVDTIFVDAVRFQAAPWI
jgi:hypothetical protein